MVSGGISGLRFIDCGLEDLVSYDFGIPATFMYSIYLLIVAARFFAIESGERENN